MAGEGETLGESLGFSYSTLGDVRIPALVYTRAALRGASLGLPLSDLFIFINLYLYQY